MLPRKNKEDNMKLPCVLLKKPGKDRLGGSILFSLSLPLPPGYTAITPVRKPDRPGKLPTATFPKSQASVVFLFLADGSPLIAHRFFRTLLGLRPFPLLALPGRE